MGIAEWIVNFIAFGLGLSLTTAGIFGILMVITVSIDGYKKVINDKSNR